VPLRPDIATPHGRIAIVELADDAAVMAALARLPEAEQARAAALSPTKRGELVAGRTALHELVGDVTIDVSDRGAPLASGWTCSVAHKSRGETVRAVALAAPAGDGFIGVDLEHARLPRIDISARILAPGEPRVTGADVLRVFAVKEAIYKAVDPIVRRYVGFTEVAIDEAGLVTSELPAAIDVWSTRYEDDWLATARARPRH
jgi:4'-phosphopantetheinyl transferase EntD